SYSCLRCHTTFELLLMYCCACRPDLPSFPTRRSSDLVAEQRGGDAQPLAHAQGVGPHPVAGRRGQPRLLQHLVHPAVRDAVAGGDRKSTRLSSSHVKISYAVFCLKKKKVKIACDVQRS